MPEQSMWRESAVAALATIGQVIKVLAEEDSMNIADIQLAAATIETGKFQALLALDDRLAQLVEVQRQLLEQQRLTNVLAAIGRTELLDWETEQAAAEYVRARIGDIVNPESETDQ